MSNFFSALGSDDDEPKARVQPKDSSKTKGEAATASNASAVVKETDRLTGAAKKNKDQQRHGAKPRSAKKTDGPVTEAVSDGKKPKREFDRNSSDPKTKKVSNSTVAGGSVQQDAADAAKNPAAFLASESAKDDAEDDAAPAAPAVQVPAVITGDEFFAQRAAKTASLASLVAPKKERKVETSTLGAKKQEEDLLEGSSLRNLSVTGLSKRLAGKQVLDIKFNIKSDLVEEERPERSDRAPRAPREGGDRPPREGGDRPPRAPREGGDRPPREGGDRAPRAPREGGDRPPRAPREGGDRPPREGGDRAPRAPREGGDRPRTGKPNTDRQGPKPDAERRPKPQSASRGVDFADAAAFPKL